MMLLPVTIMDKNLKALILLALVLLLRKFFNTKAGKQASCLLWGLLFLYLLCPYAVIIKRDPAQLSGITAIIFNVALQLEHYTRQSALLIASVIAKPQRFIIAILLVLYIVYKSVKTHLALKESQALGHDTRIQNCLEMFNFRRKITILISPKSHTPLTYGFFRPKILLTPEVLADDELLYYALIHELAHIQLGDVLWNHLRYFTACFFWHNPLIWLALKYMEEDLEIRCDKLVLQKVGDTPDQRRAYCQSLLKLVEQQQPESRIGVSARLHPTLERMKIMKNWQPNLVGVIVLALAMCFSFSAFVIAKAPIPNQVTISVPPEPEIKLKEDQVQILSKAAYAELVRNHIDMNAANITDTATLSAFDRNQYSFDMSSLAGENHSGFTINISNLMSSGPINCRTLIFENNNEIYKGTFSKPTSLKVRADYHSDYSVVIINEAPNSLTYTIKINSYN
ncbi:MAG: M56 family metallopeptidase [Eubacteriales bacterium]|nr:M56 family metallopeptidase [Clostridiales bacterium]MDY5836754.1 M56 family metallopeptidase [Eubacteriales bacterium]